MPRLSKIGAAALAAFGWTSGSAVSASYLVVAGGGGAAGNGNGGGGGGAGGLLLGTTSLNPTLSYTITVGAGGTGTTAASPSNGSNSVFNAITSIGGGAGGYVSNGVTGGSGGGGANSSASYLGAAGTSGQGSAGGNNYSFPPYPGGGGGGAGAVGANGTGSQSGAGGVGVSNSITGSAVFYAGGGGSAGTLQGATAGAGGNGGGGAGGGASANGTSGTANLGGGGGGGGNNGAYFGGNGGSGVVTISYVGAQQFSGGVVTSSGGNTIHTFTTSGTLGPVTPLSANYLVVAGGGGGTKGTGEGSGGGGAGGLLSGSSLIIDPYSTYIVMVGAGAAASSSSAATGNNGSNSSFSMVATSAVGGGGGGSGTTLSVKNGVAGGSGGGGGQGGASPGTSTGGAGTSGQGNNGGATTGYASPYLGAGGGGAGAVGSNGATAGTGNGGVGSASSISGASVTYAGGGGGGNLNGTGGTGGTGGGGSGSSTSVAPVAGTANLGGGGGGGNNNYDGAAGGSGVVIISYAGSTQLMAGGVVTIAGGNVIHTFNSSGYLTPLTLLTRSLRFRNSASAYLNRAAPTTSTNTTWTFSAWVKRGKLSADLELFGAAAASNSYDTAYFNSSDQLVFFQATSGSVIWQFTTTQVFRDPAAWYHFVFAYDSTQSTSTNRVKIYVNGAQITSFVVATYPALNGTTYFNSSTASLGQFIGRFPGSAAEYFDGYMAEINTVSGQQLAPTAFGTINSYGVWQPITYGGSYGTNGFRLPFTNNASTTTLGYDFSPQGNNWTTNNISVTAGSTYDSMTDVPTLTSATAANFAVISPLWPASYSNGSITNGNLTALITAISSKNCFASMPLPTSGKIYYELTSTYSGSGMIVGVTATPSGNDPATAGSNVFGYYNANGNKYNNGTGTAYGTAWYTSGQTYTLGVAYDADAGTLVFYLNNTSQGTAFTLTTGVSYFPTAGNVSGSGNNTINWNFGQRPFTYTPPSGYLALNTFNL